MGLPIVYPNKGSGAGQGTAAQSLDGSNAKNLISSNVVGGLPILFKIRIADAASSNVNVTMTHKITVIDAWIIPLATGDAANTFTVGNGASAISSAMVGNVDTTIARTTTIDDATQTIAAGGSLRVTWVKTGGSSACDVFVLAVRAQ
jgi:hypothetical protein